MRILITGGAGFIGCHIAESLVKQSAEVTIYDNFSSGHMRNISAIEDKVEIIKADILDPDSLLKACKGKDVIIIMQQNLR